ncbi:hypothetical protein HPB50_002082 [Hyalomma asiaticum]|uniref:Uncharacterized protein n=1 Tax=Hyalomma asiaticum TaxID=266040 RepID=A0ACB7TA31_HYAAI|nr:hypothetical protein HPB50_002082 [Hyalomma asiaticum]
MSSRRIIVLVLAAILLSSDAARAQLPTPGYQRCRMFCGIAENVRRQCCYRYNICCLIRDQLYGTPYVEPSLPYVQHDLHLGAQHFFVSRGEEKKKKKRRPRGFGIPYVRRSFPVPASPVSLEGIHWSSMSCSEPEQDTCRMSHSPTLSDLSRDNDAGYVKLPSPDCNMGRPLVYLGSFLGLLCAVGGVATATFVLAGGPRDSDMNIGPIAAARVPAGPARMPSLKPGRAAPKKEQWPSRRKSRSSTRASLDDYEEDSLNLAYNDEEDMPSAYEMRRYEFAKFRTTPTPTAPASEARPERKQVTARERFPPIWRDRPATTVSATGTTNRRTMMTTPQPRTQLSTSQGTEGTGSNTDSVGSERPLTSGIDKKASSATQSGGRVKSIESGGVSTGANPDVTSIDRPQGLLAAMPLPTRVHGPGPRSLLCLVEGVGVRPGPPLHECSHLILGDQVLDLLQKVIRPARRGAGDGEPLPMTTAAMAEQMRALRAESAPGIRLLAGLRSLEVENAYVRLWSNRSGVAASANLAYEWVRRAGLDGIALTNLVVGRHTVDVYVDFLKRLRALFREDYLIVFGFFHRESHEHDHAYTENAIRTIVRLCSFTVFEAHDVRPRPCRSFVLNALNGYRNAISNTTIVSSLDTIRRLGVPRDQTCVSMSLAVMRFLLYDRPRRMGQICHNYFPEAYSMHCREWTEIRYERGAVANTALAHRRAMAVAEIMDSFDNETTLAHKARIHDMSREVKVLIRNSGIPCVAVYNVELDDATGICESETPYSRLTAVATALRGTTLTRPTTAAPPKPAHRKAFANNDHGDNGHGANQTRTTMASHHRHRLRKRVLVAVRKRRH